MIHAFVRFNELELGELSKRAPLQCLLARITGDPSARLELDAQFDKLFSAAEAAAAANSSDQIEAVSSSSRVDLKPSDVDSAVDMFFDIMSGVKPGDFCDVPRISDNELLMTLCEFEVVSRAATEAYAESNKRPKLDQAAPPTRGLATGSMIANAVGEVPIPSAHDSLKSRFKSAKRQFGDEV